MSEVQAARTEETKPQTPRDHDLGAKSAEARRRITEKSDKLRRGEDPLEENRKLFFGDKSKDEAWDERSGSPEMAEAVEAFLEETGLSKESPVWKKLNDYQFYGRDADILNLHEKGDYSTMLRVAKDRAERALNDEARRRYVQERQERTARLQGAPPAESYAAWRKRTGRV